MNSTSKMDMITSFQFTLSHNDTLIVLKALGGRLKEDEVAYAVDLGNRLTKDRITALDRTAAQLREAITN